jgi:hypothetical protein
MNPLPNAILQVAEFRGRDDFVFRDHAMEAALQPPQIEPSHCGARFQRAASTLVSTFFPRFQSYAPDVAGFAR